MLNFDQIRKEFESDISGINAYRAMVKEYLQCKILESVYKGPFKDKLIFLGGTKLRLLNNFKRFSEDLDFDLKGDYYGNDLLALCEFLVDEFKKQNIKAEIDKEKKIREIDVQTRYINFPDILEKVGLKDVPGRKFFIKLDAQRHNFGPYSYKADTLFLNRFDVFTPLNCAPDSMILATKLCSILERSKGRDFYDIVELVKTTKTDIDYIKNRLKYGRLQEEYSGPDSYLNLVKPILETVDWADKTREIENFIFYADEAIKVQMFPSFASDKQIRSWLEN